MASSPGFDANQLEEQWAALIEDPGSPLVNRATMGYYPVGKLLEGILPAGKPVSEVLTNPQIRLPDTEPFPTTTSAATPLQLSLLAAALSNGGAHPAPLLVQAVNTSLAGWVLLPPLEESRQLLTEDEARNAIEPLTHAHLPLWQKVAVARMENGQAVTWFMGGTLPGDTLNPLAVAVLLEEEDPTIAEEIGQSILQNR